MNRLPLPISAARLLGTLLLLVVLGAAQAAEPQRVLIFSKTAGFRHDSIPVAVAALQRLAAQESLAADHSEDASAFTASNLSRYRAVVFVSTTGDVLDESQQRALEKFVGNGGGFMGVHSAADTEYDWPWYGGLVGAWFHSHPPGLQTTRVTFESGAADAPADWTVTDEIYNYRSNPRGQVTVLATVDEHDYEGGTMGEDHPIAWCHAYSGGRAWYTGLGHDVAMYQDAVFLAQLRRGLRYAAGLAADC
ncbi:ThuA domain-containing protein [Pseudoxanthomonas wuyuanensis]